MNLVTFNEGIQSIRIERQTHSEQPNSSSRSFVPRGESVIQHTEALFTLPGGSETLLQQLITSGDQASADPVAFDRLAENTTQQLTALMANPAYENELLQPALKVLQDLASDRHMLLSNISALEKG